MFNFFCSGKILHIDFGDCFEASMNREKFPEKVSNCRGKSRLFCILLSRLFPHSTIYNAGSLPLD